MNKKKSLFLGLELIWWVATAIIVFGILYPICTSITTYPFLVINVIFVVIFITFTRYVFLLKHTFLAPIQILKIILGILCLPIILYLISQLNYFQVYLDEQGLESFMGELSLKKQSQLAGYIRTEMLFFGVGSIIIAILLPIRLLVSVWRAKNRGTV